MKKLIFAVALLFASCAAQEETPYVVEFANNLISQYPNFESNDIARASIKDAVREYATSLPVGSSPAAFDGIEFKFAKLLDSDTGKTAVFVANETALIDSNGGATKYIIANIKFRVFGRVSQEIAASLDSNMRYKITGRLHAWDEADLLFVSNLQYDDINFGTFILSDMTIETIKK